MILTNCAVCAAPLAHDAPHQCVRCQLRYCSPDCQQHYWRSGHQENCEIIHRGGDAEQYLRINGEEDRDSLLEAHNLASSFISLERFEEARSLMRKTIPVAQRVAGEDAEVTLRMRWRYAEALCWDTAATLDDVREAVTTLEETLPTARRVLGGAHPLIKGFEDELQDARAALRARETPSPPPSGSV